MTDVKEYANTIRIKWQSRYVNKGFQKQDNVGFDTETYLGYARLICDSLGKTLIWIPNHPKYKEKPFFEEILEFHTRHELRNKKNFYYNQRFDFNVIFKHLFDIDESLLRELYELGATRYKKYEIYMIEGKRIRIIYQENYYEFFDLAQFTHLKLDDACEYYLTPSGIPFSKKSLTKEEVESLNENKDDIWENLSKIIAYCKIDALKCKLIADVFFDIIRKHLGLEVKSPYSEAAIAQQYTLQTNVGEDGKSTIPTTNEFIDMRQPKEQRLFYQKVLQYGMLTYYAGRFEVLKKGYFENAIEYDIVSAYPAQMRTLIDVSPSKGIWKYVTELHKNAHYGYYLVRVFNRSESVISPFKAWQKKNDSNLYPSYIEGGLLYMTKTEIDFILNNKKPFGDVSIEILNGYEFYPDELVFPYRKQVDTLFEWKDRLNKSTDKPIRDMVKVLLNAPYGKTWQAIEKESGNLWNPFYATEICAGNRVKLLELALQSPESVVSMSTDSITSIKPLTVPSNPKLGVFQKEFEGKLISLSSGQLDFWNEEIIDDKTGLPIAKIKRRGTNKPKEGRPDLERFLKTMGNNSTLKLIDKNPRPISMREAIHENKISEAGMWFNDQIEINLNSDKKRLWDDEHFTGKKALKGFISSIPQRIEEIDNLGVVDHLGGK